MAKMGGAVRGKQLALTRVPPDSPLHAPARTPEDVRERLAHVVAEVASYRLSPSAAMAMTASLRALGELLERRREAQIPGADGAWAVVYEEPAIEVQALPASKAAPS